MSAVSLKTASSSGVTKHKVRRVSTTRNRSKVEKLRESLTDLRLEEKQIEATRNKLSKDDPSLRVWLHDIRISDHDQGSGISVQTNTFPLGTLGGSIKRRSCQKPNAEKSPGNSESSGQNRSEKSKCDSSGSRLGMSICCLEMEDKYLLKSTEETEQLESDWNAECQTPVSETVSACIGDNNSPKRKCDNNLQETKSKNFKATRVEWQMLSLSAGEETCGSVSEDPNIAIVNDQRSPSPPNSPLYDMPPPSTPAQKRARRAKRHLQLERWKKYEASRSRQERYQKRAQETVGTIQRSVSLDSRRVQWSHDLVQTVYIDHPYQ